MEEFIDQGSAISGLLGALLGVLASFLASWSLKKRDYTLRAWDKLLERRIQAHEDVIAIALEMKIMIGLGGIEDSGEVARTPQVLVSKEEFDRWFARFAQNSKCSTIEAKRELNCAQDYLITLNQNLANVQTGKYRVVGQVIRQDFIDLSSCLERAAFRFFEYEIHKLQLDSLNDWHKNERPKTEKRLMQTALIKNWTQIQRILTQSSNERSS